MKTFASTAMILTSLFMSLVGSHGVNGDSKFAKSMPWLYKNLAFFGLRIPSIHNGKPVDEKIRFELIRDKLYVLAEYLIMSILIRNYYISMKAIIESE